MSRMPIDVATPSEEIQAGPLRKRRVLQTSVTQVNSLLSWADRYGEARPLLPLEEIQELTEFRIVFINNLNGVIRGVFKRRYRADMGMSPFAVSSYGVAPFPSCKSWLTEPSQDHDPPGPDEAAAFMHSAWSTFKNITNQRALMRSRNPRTGCSNHPIAMLTDCPSINELWVAIMDKTPPVNHPDALQPVLIQRAQDSGAVLGKHGLLVAMPDWLAIRTVIDAAKAGTLHDDARKALLRNINNVETDLGNDSTLTSGEDSSLVSTDNDAISTDNNAVLAYDDPTSTSAEDNPVPSQAEHSHAVLTNDNPALSQDQDTQPNTPSHAQPDGSQHDHAASGTQVSSVQTSAEPGEEQGGQASAPASPSGNLQPPTSNDNIDPCTPARPSTQKRPAQSSPSSARARKKRVTEAQQLVGLESFDTLIDMVSHP